MFESVMTICGCIFIFWITVCISCVGYLWIKYDLLPAQRERSRETKRLHQQLLVIREIRRADQAYMVWAQSRPETPAATDWHLLIGTDRTKGART